MIRLSPARRTLLDRAFRRGSTLLRPLELVPARMLEGYGYVKLRQVDVPGEKPVVEMSITKLGREAHSVEFAPRPSVWEQMARARGIIGKRKESGR